MAICGGLMAKNGAVEKWSSNFHVRCNDNAINRLSRWYAYGVTIGYISAIRLNVRCYPISAVWYIPCETYSLTSPNHFELRLDAITLKQPVNRLQSICKQCKNIGDTMKILTKRITMAFGWTIKMRFCCHVTFGSVLHLHDKWAALPFHFMAWTLRDGHRSSECTAAAYARVMCIRIRISALDWILLIPCSSVMQLTRFT